MKHLFVPYKLALLAKEKGFNEPTRDYYRATGSGPFDENGKYINWNDDSKLETAGGMTYVSAPLYQQLVDWFREEFNIVIWVETSLSISSWNYRFKIETEDDKQEGHKTKDYYKSLTEALFKAFKIIP